MQTYKEFQPTGFDPKGLNAERYQIGDFLVLPCAQNRDSGCLDRSNFEVALKELGGESEDVQVHRFGHWGPGWFEIILVNPANEEKARIAEEIEASLENYSILDEFHYSELEFETASNYWSHCSIQERVEWCQRYDVSIFAARRDYIPEDSRGELISRLSE